MVQHSEGLSPQNAKRKPRSRVERPVGAQAGASARRAKLEGGPESFEKGGDQSTLSSQKQGVDSQPIEKQDLHSEQSSLGKGSVVDGTSSTGSLLDFLEAFRDEVTHFLEDHARRVEKAVHEQRQMRQESFDKFNHFAQEAVDPLERLSPKELDDEKTCDSLSDHIDAGVSSSVTTSLPSRQGVVELLGSGHSEGQAADGQDQPVLHGKQSFVLGNQFLRALTSVRPALSANLPAQGKESPEGFSGKFLTGVSAFEKSGAFESCTQFTIIAYTLFMGFQVDFQIQSLHPNTSVDNTQQALLNGIETTFCVIFLFELVIRTIAGGWKTELRWFVFDAILVIGGIINEVEKLTSSGEERLHGSTLITIRLCRMLRLLRMVRLVKAFRELRVVVMAIGSCTRPLFWTMFLLLLLIYFLTTCLLTSAFAHQTHVFDSSESGKKRLELYGSFIRTMLTLFQSISSGIDWNDASAPMEELVPWVAIVFTMYVACVVFAIMNVVTGVFVDQAMACVSKDQDLVEMEERSKRQGIVKQIERIFRDASDGSDSISSDHMGKLIDDPRIRAFFKQLDMEVWDVQTFLELVDSDNNLIDVESFVNGCLRVKGVAKNIDLIALKYHNQVLATRQEKTLEATKELISQLVRNTRH
eukprot:TRINITY_DN6161_c1_g1_i1.p1 TRINITY_DN6161_c1_g1~~TRINITY_DN6161_c1_g1_i1.p1  ORF type:complete len:642 (-),score=117.53 TRINITY_DN6161_c1_g1_i1:54-1979(-)